MMKKTVFCSVFGLLMLAGLCSVSRAQGAAYLWVRNNQDATPAGYTSVVGGKLKDGTKLLVCRAQLGNGWLVPGKYYNKMCLVPWSGKEENARYNFDFLVTNATPHWKAVHDLSKAQITDGAVFAASGMPATGKTYICRKQMSDGVHPGKYAIGNGLCYISWGGKETYTGDDFEILFHD